MPLQKTEAVVLKSQRSGETSKIVTLFTPKLGKLRVVAKGSRGMKSRFFGTLEPLNHISIVYYFKETREYQYLSQADIIHAHEKIKSDLKKYALANVLCELVERTELPQPNPYLFQILIDALAGINKSQGQLDGYLIWFLLRFLKINGFEPDVSRCRQCGAVSAEGVVYFSLPDGSYACGNCTPPLPNRVTVSAATILYLRQLKAISIKHVESIVRPPFAEAEMLLFAFLNYHIEEAKYLKTVKFLRQIQVADLDHPADQPDQHAKLD